MANKRFRNKPNNKKPDYNPPYSAELLSEPITDLKLREETLKLLVGAGLSTIRDLAVRTEKDFYRIHTFNKKNLLDVKNALKVKKVALRPDPTAVTAPIAETAAAVDKTKQIKDKQGKNNKTRDKYAVDETFVMTTLPPKPPRPKTVPVKEEHDAYVKINRGGKWGFKDRNGKQTVEPVYDEVFCFKEDLCCVEKDERFGFINRQGEIVVPIEYDCATSFSEGYACVFKREKCGYINASNEVVVKFEFDAGTPIQGGECRVKKDGKWGEMHVTKGENGYVLSEIRWIT